MCRVAAILFALAALTLAACGDDGDNGGDRSGDATDQTTQEAQQEPDKEKSKEQASEKPDPETCILRGGSSNVRRPDDTLWVGGDPLMRVREYDSAGEAQADVDAATDVFAKRVGRYAVLGPLKDVEPDGDEAVATVADCLRNG
jgi:hypothetical protein